MILFEMQFSRAPKFWGKGSGRSAGAQGRGFREFLRSLGVSVTFHHFVEMLLNFPPARDHASAKVWHIVAAANHASKHRFVKPNVAWIVATQINALAGKRRK